MSPVLRKLREYVSENRTLMSKLYKFLKVEVQNDVFITVKSAEKDIVSDLSDATAGSLNKLAAFTKKLFSLSQSHKVIFDHCFG